MSLRDDVNKLLAARSYRHGEIVSEQLLAALDVLEGKLALVTARLRSAENRLAKLEAGSREPD